MKLVTEKEYYTELAKLRDRYLSENTDKWRATNVAIFKFDNTDESVNYDSEYKKLEKYANSRLELIDEELKAKKQLRDETLAAIDAEVEARKRLTEDNDIQDEINAVTAELKYTRGDDFSRMQLEKKLEDLQEQQAALAWERNVSDRKSAANEEYNAAETAAKQSQEAINDAVDTVKEVMAQLSAGITNITNAVENVTNNNTTNNNTANVNFTDQPMTNAQIVRLIKDLLGG